jgi:6-phosphogluconolactonase
MKQSMKEILVYISSYTQESPVGIRLYSLELSSGKLSSLGHDSQLSQASYMAIDSNRMKLYAVSETGEYEGKAGGSVAAYDIDANSGHLTWLNQKPTYGGAPCFVSLDQTASCLYVSNYSKGNVSVFPVEEDGKLGEASDIHQHEGEGPNLLRQDGPHAHSITPDFNNRFAIAADLGIDQLVIYDMDIAGRKLKEHNAVHLQAGAGPRHIAFRLKASSLYVLNELNSTVTAMRYDQAKGNASPMQTISTLPREFKGENTGADIHISPDERFLYASNRGHNSIVAFAIGEENGMLTPIGHYPTLGETPRNFAITPDGKYLLAANQDSGEVRISRIDQASGELIDTGHAVQLPQPVCIKMLDLGAI